jgi:hypothetical protein
LPVEDLLFSAGGGFLSRIRQLAACKAEVIIVDPSNTTQRWFNARKEN